MKPKLYMADYQYFLWASKTMQGRGYEPFEPLGVIRSPLDLKSYMGTMSDGGDSLFSSLGFPALVIYDKIMVTSYAQLAARRGRVISVKHGRVEQSETPHQMSDLYNKLRARGIISHKDPPGFPDYSPDTRGATSMERAFKQGVSAFVKADLEDREIVRALIGMMDYWPLELWGMAFPELESIDRPTGGAPNKKEEDEYNELSRRLTESCDELSRYLLDGDKTIFTKISSMQAEYLVRIESSLRNALGRLLRVINTHFLFSASEGMDILAYPWAMPFIIYKLFKGNSSSSLFQAFSNITLLIPVSGMSIEGLFELRSRFAELSSEIGQYMQFYGRKDMGGLIGSYKQLRHSRERFLRYALTRQGRFGLINATISLTDRRTSFRKGRAVSSNGWVRFHFVFQQQWS